MKKILFITKNFPPQKGGIENYSKDLYENLKQYTTVYLIANGKGKYFLPIFGLIAFFKGIYLVRKVDIIYIGDGSISLIGYLLGKLFKKEIYITIHGLDITWQNKIYQKVIPPIIQKFDKIIAVSSNTKQICIDKGVSEDKISVIYNGLHFNSLPEFNANLSRNNILNKYGIQNTEGKKILFSVGRFVERKGIHTFLENSFPQLNQEQYIYILGGFGKYEQKYKKIISENKLNNVHLIGKLDINQIAELETVSDLFIMPNIEVNGDVEGFGIVIIEAGYYGLPILGTAREGLKDSIINNKTGILIEDDEERTQNWVGQIENFNYNHFHRKDVQNEVIENFSWDTIIKQYLELIK